MVDEQQEGYFPESDFLRALVADEISLEGSEFAEANLQRLIEATKAEVLADRDWATMLLAQSGLDTPEVRLALVDRADDADGVVRGEAILGLAERDRDLAVPLILRGLSGETVYVPILQAVIEVPDPSFIEDLKVWAEPSDDPYIDGWARDALEACLRASQ